MIKRGGKEEKGSKKRVETNVELQIKMEPKTVWHFKCRVI